MVTFDGTFTITKSTFTNNNSTEGGVMNTNRGIFHIIDSTFQYNMVTVEGGVIRTSYGTFTIIKSTFTNNNSTQGGVMNTNRGIFHIIDSTFQYNTVTVEGGVIRTSYGTFTITDSNFTNNIAQVTAGVLVTTGGLFIVTRSTFTNNEAKHIDGGVLTVMRSLSVPLFTFTRCSFDNNTAMVGGVMSGVARMSVTIVNSAFTNNKALLGSGVIFSMFGMFHISGSKFINNVATANTGVLWIGQGTANITDSVFSNNSANVDSGAIFAQSGTLLYIENTSFNNNSANGYGGVLLTIESRTHIADCTFNYNSGSLYVLYGNLTISGNSRFENGIEPFGIDKAYSAFTRQEGGALTSFQSNVIISGNNIFLNNRAREGGAILSIESRLTLYGTTANNLATDSYGGGVSLHESNLDIQGSCTINENYAKRGGGVFSRSSSIAVHPQGSLQIISNNAENGGGLYLEVNPKLYILRNEEYSSNRFSFINNHAKNYGGAMYVADDTSSGACLLNSECFFQSLALYQDGTDAYVVFLLNGNTAGESGSNLFGGLLDRCTASAFAEVQKQSTRIQYIYGGAYIKSISNIAQDTVSSSPVRVCFCKNEREPDCSYRPPLIEVQKGQAFNISLVAVDQFDHPLGASVLSSLALSGGGFSEGQQIQNVQKECTNLTFNVFSPHDYETITLFADGPCGSSTPSIKRLDIQFLNCTCPIGFQPSNTELSRCDCICDSKVALRYTTNCDPTTSSIVRVNTNSWIIYINETDPPDYVIHPNCPFDYCKLPTENVSINLNLPNGADEQCAFNRTGILCGACQEHLSLSLGSSHCLPCPGRWPAILAVILIAAIIAGILLVTVMLALNMTVVIGLINGFIFYANIVAVNSAIFFPSEHKFPTVFVAWLNLDIGIDVCFFDGLDTYTKTWLQLAFPAYIIFLVVVVIKISEHSPRFVRLIGRRDPIATLATLVLLSYAKLLSITISILSFAILEYPDGLHDTVWLPDGNVKFFRGKHMALVVAAFLILLAGVPFTVLLLLWQWIIRAPKWKVFQWTRNTKLNSFITAYHVPYNNKYRYWTGLLLLVRVVLYVTASVTASDNPQTSLLTTSILIGGLFLIKGSIGLKVYKKSFMDIFETVIYFKLLVLTIFTMYDFKADPTKQTAVAYISTIVAFLLFIGVVIYHVALLINRGQKREVVNEYPPVPDQTINTEITHSVVDVLDTQTHQSEGADTNSTTGEVGVAKSGEVGVAQENID